MHLPAVEAPFFTGRYLDSRLINCCCEPPYATHLVDKPPLAGYICSRGVAKTSACIVLYYRIRRCATNAAATSNV